MFTTATAVKEDKRSEPRFTELTVCRDWMGHGSNIKIHQAGDPSLPALGRQRPKGHKFETSLGYITRPAFQMKILFQYYYYFL